MCAIAGILNLNGDPVAAPMVRRMTDVMIHRGPDDHGVFIDRHVGLGHRRLAIIDLSPAGHQPMSNEDGTVCVVFNGEVYNYLELIPILQEKGYRFKSRTDTEVVLHSYEEWGEDCVRRFNGMWGLAIWDANRNRLFLSRDRFGVKPLYYYAHRGQVVFASEIKAILAVVPEARRPDYAFLHHFLSSSLYDDGEETFFEGVKALLPAHSLVIEGGGMRMKRYWQFDPVEAGSRYDYAHPETTFRDLLRDSVRLRLRSDVPVGTCLSGGLDSSSIVSLATGMMDHGVKTFSVIYDDPDCNEQFFVDRLNRHCRADPCLVFPRGNDLFDVLPKIVWHQDGPTGGPSVYSQWHVMQAAQGKVKVLLDGQGSDELLGGYFHFFAAYLASLAQDFSQTKHPSRLISLIRSIRHVKALMPQSHLWGPLAHCLPEPARNALYRARRFVRRLDLKTVDLIPPVLHPDFTAAVKGAEITRDHPDVFDDELNNRLYWSLVSQSVPALLHTEDRNSMAFSIEARTPFLDYRLVEFCLGLSYDWKIREGTTKFILRRALATDLPQEISGRLDKKGYPTPMARWFRESQRDKMKEILYSDEARRRNIFHFPGIQYRVERHCSGKADASWEIYRWLTTELWFREFLD